MNLSERLKRLEQQRPKKIDYGAIYDTIIEMDCTVPATGDFCEPEQTRLLAEQELGDRQQFIEDRQRIKAYVTK